MAEYTAIYGTEIHVFAKRVLAPATDLMSVPCIYKETTLHTS
jgi:hypothetical protein